MSNEIEIWLKIPEGYSLKGCKTDGDTAIAIFTPIINHSVIGFVAPPPGKVENDEEFDEE